MNSLDDYIMVIDDIMPQDVVDELMGEYKNSNAWMDYRSGKSGGETPAQSILLSHRSIILNSPV